MEKGEIVSQSKKKKRDSRSEPLSRLRSRNCFFGNNKKGGHGPFFSPSISETFSRVRYSPFRPLQARKLCPIGQHGSLDGSRVGPAGSGVVFCSFGRQSRAEKGNNDDVDVADVDADKDENVERRQGPSVRIRGTQAHVRGRQRHVPPRRRALPHRLWRVSAKIMIERTFFGRLGADESGETNRFFSNQSFFFCFFVRRENVLRQQQQKRTTNDGQRQLLTFSLSLSSTKSTTKSK